MRVFGWVADKAGCGYYRLGRPLQVIRAQHPDVATAAGNGLTEDVFDNWDLIVGQRVAKRTCSDWWQLQDRGRLIYELDDDLWNVPDHSAAYVETGRDGIHQRMRDNIRHAGAVTVSTAHLADVVAPMTTPGTPIHVIPNYIDEWLLTWDRTRGDKPTIGWAGSNTHQRDFAAAAPALKRFFGKNRGWDMHFVGTEYAKQIGHHSLVTPWVNGVSNYLKCLDFDIGLAPLTSNEFNRSKSPLKALEYAALGIPVIASDFGPYSDFVQDGVTGFLCKTDHDWFRALRTLAADPDLRQQMGAAAREQAAAHTIEANIWRYLEVYEQAMANA